MTFFIYGLTSVFKTSVKFTVFAQGFRIQNDEKTDSIFWITASWLLLCEIRIYIFSVKKTSHEDKIKKGLE